MLDRRTTAHAALGLAFVAAVAVARVARAEMTLRWDAPPNCPQRDEVLERIRALAGSSLEKTDALSVEGRIERAGRRYSLTLLVRDGRDVRTRVITSESCSSLAGAAAVTLALLLGIDVSAALSPETGATPDAAPSGAGTTTNPGAGGASGAQRTDDATRSNAARDSRKESARSANENEPPPDPDATPPSTRRWAVVARMPAAHADFGPLPRPALGLGLGGGFRYDSWQVLLAGHVSLKQTVNAPAPNAASGADLSRITAELSVCHGWGADGFELAPCLAVALEHVSASGFGGAGVAPRSARTAWPALGAGGVGRWHPWKSLAIFGSVTGYAEFSRPVVVIEGIGNVVELGSVAAGTALGAEWIF